MGTATKKRLRTLKEAQIIADKLQQQLQPFCKDDKCVVAGSIRRKAPSVGDIEIVCIPRRETAVPYGELFPKPDVNLLLKHLRENETSDARGYKIIKGGDRYHKILFGGMQADVFMTNKQQWGRMLALRTGPAEYSKKMAQRWSDMGYKGVNGKLVDVGGESYCYKPEFPTEQDFFDFLGWDYVKPENRK